MTSEDSPPTDSLDIAGDWEATREAKSARDRVYEVAIQLYDPERVATVAERADCAKETARDYLRWMADARIVLREGDNPETYRRNESYFEWKRVFELQKLPEDELSTRLSTLTEREADLREQYDADDPKNVDALEHADYPDVEAVWDDLREWEAVREEIRFIERARQERSTSSAPA